MPRFFGNNHLHEFSSDIYEYLIGMFAANAGKKAGEFYTPHEVSVLMSEIIAHHLKGKKTIEIYDSTSGSGSLLLNIGQSIAKQMADKNNIKYYAQELKENTYNLTRMNLVMRGLNVATYADRDLRQAIALQKAKAATPQEAFDDPDKKKVFNRYINEVPMAGHRDEAGNYHSGIEDLILDAQYRRDEHRNAVVKDIAKNWITLSQGGKFHAIFATNSISDAITYYRLMKVQSPHLKITCLFDPNIDNDEDDHEKVAFKTEGLVEILSDYNTSYGQHFDLGSHANFKKDLAARLAHKKPYVRIEAEPDKRLDLLIVVDQMLTGFDSKWINTLYLDKLLEYETIIQAFSRTNRLFGPDKPFGTIRYYRRPHTMTKNVEAAVKLGDAIPWSRIHGAVFDSINATSDKRFMLSEVAKVAALHNVPSEQVFAVLGQIWPDAAR